jgi:hypothetical protein
MNTNIGLKPRLESRGRGILTGKCPKQPALATHTYGIRERVVSLFITPPLPLAIKNPRNLFPNKKQGTSTTHIVGNKA